MPQTPLNLGQLFTSQSPFVPNYDRTGDDFGLAGIGNAIAGTVSALSQGQQAAAIRAKTEEEVRRMRAEAAAKRTLAEMIGGLGQTSQAEVFSEGSRQGALQPGEVDANDPLQLPDTYDFGTPDQRLAAERAVAARNFNPANLAGIYSAGVLADDPGTGANIANILSGIAVGNRDADTVAGFRSSAMAPGTQVFQSGADLRAGVEDEAKVAAAAAAEAAATGRNDADNATSRANNDATIANLFAMNTADNEVETAKVGAADRATRATLETARAAQLDGRRVRAAVNFALGIGPDEDVIIPADLRTRLAARTAELIQSEGLDENTAAARAVEELVRADKPLLGGGRRRFRFNPGTEQAPAAAPSRNTNGAPPEGATVDDETGEVFDAQGRVIGHVPPR